MRNKELVGRRESRGFIWNVIPPINNSYGRAMPQNPRLRRYTTVDDQ